MPVTICITVYDCNLNLRFKITSHRLPVGCLTILGSVLKDTCNRRIFVDARDLKNYDSFGSVPLVEDEVPYLSSEWKAKYDRMLQLFSNLLGREEEETEQMIDFVNSDSLNEQLDKLAELLDFYKSNIDLEKALLATSSNNQDPKYHYQKNRIKNVHDFANQLPQVEHQIKSKKLGSSALISPFKKSSNLLLSSPFKKSYFLQSPFKKSQDE